MLRVLLPTGAGKWNSVGGKKAKDAHTIGQQLFSLCTGHSSADPLSNWTKILKTDLDGMKAEAIEQEKQFGLLAGCSIRTFIGKSEKALIVEIRQSQPPVGQTMEARDHDLENKKVGQSYIIDAPSTFPKDGETMKLHRIFGREETLEWEFNVVRNLEGSDAIITGVIQNSFDDASDFVGEEDNVSLTPIIIDVVGDRIRQTQGFFMDRLDEYEEQAKGFMSNPKYPPKIPAFEFFSGQDCKEELNKHDQGLELTLPIELKDKLNESQFAAVEKLLGRKISVQWGPPGTGKSRVLAESMMLLLEHTQEKMLACAVANVAVDAIYLKVVEAHRNLNDSKLAPIARVYSETQTRAQCAAQDWATLRDDYHIEQWRVREANADKETWQEWLDAREDLLHFGSFSNEQNYAVYTNLGRQLSRTILDIKIRVVFCTVAACQSGTLYEYDVKRKAIVWAYGADSVFLDEAGTAHRPLVLMPVMAFVKTLARVVLAGDPFQLPAFRLSGYTKEHWVKSFLREIIRQGWPCTLLDTQYRMPEALYDHLIAKIYGKVAKGFGVTIKSARTMDKPSAYGKQLAEAMPLRFTVGHQAFSLTSYLNFVDVADGIQHKRLGGSSSNVQEVDAIDAMIQALKSKGLPGKSIAVCTGYTDQKRLLKVKAKANGWEDVRQIMTNDSSQSDEYKIVILSLVTCQNQAGFMGTLYRACVGTSRQMEALYFVGKAEYWFSYQQGGFKMMHDIVKYIESRSAHWGRPAFVIRSGDPT